MKCQECGYIKDVAFGCYGHEGLKRPVINFEDNIIEEVWWLFKDGNVSHERCDQTFYNGTRKLLNLKNGKCHPSTFADRLDDLDEDCSYHAHGVRVKLADGTLYEYLRSKREWVEIKEFFISS